LWLRERLRRAGIRSIAAAVDVTNYVMLELGQPMHAYDLATLDGALVVRRARTGETLTLLDGRTVSLDPDVLVIADRSKLLGLAGVMGGEGSGIADGTIDVLLEVAHFRPEAIAGRGRRFGLVTDASQRFERGVDPTLPVRALERATELLLACAGGRAGPAQLEEQPEELAPMPRVRLRWPRARRVIGADFDDQRMQRILAGLGMELDADGADAAWVTPPPWRFDIGIEEDLIEEIARVEGFDSVPERPGVGLVRMPPSPEALPRADAIADRLVQRGYHEAITYSFVDPRWQSLLFPREAAMTLANPISTDLAVMRISLWPGLLKACADNQRHQQPRVRLFETGRRFAGTGAELREIAVVAGVAAGTALPEQWGESARDVDFFDLKGDVDALLRMSGEPRSFVFEPAEHPALHPGQSARILRDGEPVGWIGRVHPRVAKALDLTYSALVFELDVERGLAARLPAHREVSRFPAVRRDLAFVVDEAVSMRAIETCIRAAAGALLTELVVFDLYRGAGIETGRKSVATGLILQDVSRTLAEQDIEAVVARVASDLGRECNATIRDK
jgi:phenylalanyl-tRNA synthetase beta chain